MQLQRYQCPSQNRVHGTQVTSGKVLVGPTQCPEVTEPGNLTEPLESDDDGPDSSDVSLCICCCCPHIIAAQQINNQRVD
jgi:hypothetical protein